MTRITPTEINVVPARDTIRSPVTVLRILAATIALVVAIVLLVGSGGDSSTFSGKLGRALKSPPQWFVNSTVGLLQLITFTAPVAGLLALSIRRRFARIARIVVAGALTTGVLFGVSILAGTSVLQLGGPRPAVYGPGAAFPTTIGLGILGAGILVDAPWWPTGWRRVATIVMICAIGARLGSALAHPTTIAVAMSVAATAAAASHLLLGVPNHRPRADDVAAVLNRFGYSDMLVTATGSPGFRGISTFAASSSTGRTLCIKVVNRESWAALLPGRIYRSLRFRELGEERPFVSLRHRVEHEALCALKAHSDGVPTPRLAIVTKVGHDAMLLAFDTPHLRSFNELEPHERDSDLLARVWQTVVALRRSHIVHHRLNSDYLQVDDQLNVVVSDFSTAELGAKDQAMSSDVAEVLAITAARLGVQIAVAAATEALGPTALAVALPRLQSLALTRSTRAEVKEAKCLDDLRDEVQRVTGATSAPVDELERIKPRTVLTIAMTALGLWAILPQALGAGDLWGHVRTANWWWALAALGLSAITYLGAAIALDGSTPDRLPLGPNLGVQLATSFAGVAAPGGGLALSARFLQRRGIDPAVSVAAVGIDTAAGVMVHFSLLGVFLAWSGTSGLKTFNVPPLRVVELIAIAIGLVALVVSVIPRTRNLLIDHVVPPIRRAARGIAETARHPSNLVELFGGSATITVGYLLALAVSIRAFDAGPPFTSVALVYLVGSVVSSVAPTPGGIGAVEATLVAGLTSAGMRSDTALGAVLLYRAATFWLPLLAGWFAFTALQRAGDL